MQLGEMTAERDQRRLALGARRGETLHLAQRIRRIAAACRVDEGLERRLGRVADDRLDVVMRDLARAFGIERELRHLRA